MKSSFKIFTTLALATVGASMANANAYGSGSGYATASYLQNYGGGLYYSAVSGQYYGVYQFAIGNSAVGDSYGGGFNYSADSGASISAPTYPYSWGYGTSYNENYTTITNGSNYNSYLFIKAYTSASSYSYATSWSDIGYGYGTGAFFDSAGILFQESFAETAAQGLGYTSFAYASNYDTNFGGSYSYARYAPIFPMALSAGAADLEYYELVFSPGASDTFYYYGASTHSAYSTTPGPVAVAPFALGLLGALRRRKKA